jgi:hypothetical protein
MPGEGLPPINVPKVPWDPQTPVKFIALSTPTVPSEPIELPDNRKSRPKKENIPPKAGRTQGLVWLKFVGGISLAMAAIIAYAAIFAQPPADQVAAVNALNRVKEENDQIQTIQVTVDDMNNMVTGLNLSSAAPAAVQPTVPVLAAQAPEPIRAAVAKIAAQPAAVIVTTSAGKTQQYIRSVGQVYEHASQSVRDAMVNPAPQSDHGYDQNDPNGCFETDCLSPHKDFMATDKDATTSADFDSGGIQSVEIKYPAGDTTDQEQDPQP